MILVLQSSGIPVAITMIQSVAVNGYFAAVVVALLADYAIRTTADVLSLRSLWKGLPESLHGVYDESQYEASQRYAEASTRVEIVERTTLLIVVLGFWFLGGFAWLDETVRVSVSSTLPRGLLYLGSVVVGYGALSLPFDAYRTFSLESRFGFNRTSVFTFLSDRAKALALLVVIGGALAAIIVSTFMWLGSFAWLFCLIAVAVFILLTQAVAPIVILPLFNRYNSMPEGELRAAVLSYASSVNFPVQDVYVIDGSRRSSRANAFFTGLGRNKRIALFDTLIERHSVKGLIAVLAHEAGHYKRGHITKGIAATILHAAILLALLGFFLDQPALFHAFGVSDASVYVGLVLFSLLYTPVETALSVVFNMVSRRHEYEADHFAVDTTHDSAALVDALKKLSADNLSNPHPHRLQVLLNYSHPPLVMRLESIQRRALAAGR